MKLRTKIFYGLFCVLFVLAMCVALSAVSGCGQSVEQQKLVGQLIDANNKLKAGVVATTQQSPQIAADIAALPPGKIKDEATAILAKGNEYAAKAIKGSDDASKILTAAQSGDAGGTIAATAGALSGVPGVGPYAGLIGLLASVGYGAYQNAQKKKATAAAQEAMAQAQEALDLAKETQGHLKNVVHSIEYAGPEWTPDHAAAIAGIQGPETTAAVNAIKAEIGIQPVAPAAAMAAETK
jgi:hypothetical protein